MTIFQRFKRDNGKKRKLYAHPISCLIYMTYHILFDIHTQDIHNMKHAALFDEMNGLDSS